MRTDIWGYWEQMDAAGQFEPIVAELAANSDPMLKFTYGVPQRVELNYQASNASRPFTDGPSDGLTDGPSDGLTDGPSDGLTDGPSDALCLL